MTNLSAVHRTLHDKFHSRNAECVCQIQQLRPTELRVWYFMWLLKHAKQVSWIGIMLFWNRKEGLWLYRIFKQLILLFGFIMMFDTTMFLLSFDTDYSGWKHKA